MIENNQINGNPSNNGSKRNLKSLDDEIKIDVRAIISKYLHYLPLFIITLLLSFTILYFYLRYTRPVFKSTIKILVKDDDKKTGTSDLSKQILSGMISGGKSNVANELELIKSYTLMEKVVRRLDINTNYSSIGNVTTNELYKDKTSKFIHFANINDSNEVYQAVIKVKDNKIWLVDKKNNKLTEIPNNRSLATPFYTILVHIENPILFNPRYEYKATWYSPLAMAKMLASSLEVEPLNKEASIIKLSMQSELPAKSTDILNALSIEYNNASVDEKNRMADNTIKFIDERLILISGELGGVENNLKNFRQANNVIDETSQGKFMLDRLQETQSNLDKLDVQMQVVDLIAEYVNNPARKYSLTPSSLGIQDPVLLNLLKQYNEEVINRENLLKTLAPGNIAVMGVESQIQHLQANIIETADNLKKSFRTAYTKTKTDNNGILQTMNTIPLKEKQLLEISRQQGIKEKLYIYLLEKREESAITRASAVSNSVPIDPATTDLSPESPKKKILLGIALAVGLGIPLIFVYIKQLLSDKVITKADIEQYTKAPIIGEISHDDNNERRIIADKSRGPISEQFRIIRTNLQYFLPGATRNTILITSTMPGEGKTFVCMNMGAVLANAGKKVVLLEFDMRKPKIGEALNLHHNGKGLSTYLSGNANLDEIILPILDIPNYFFIPTGPVPPNPAELLLQPQMELLFKELKSRFDYIVIDTPPTAIVSDAKILANYSDVNFYIIRQRVTLKKQIAFINELYEGKIFKNMGLVINDTILTGADGYYGDSGPYGYGNGYNYDYSYGYGYGQEKEKKGLRKLFGKN